MATARAVSRALTILSLAAAGCAGDRNAVVQAPGAPVEVSQRAYKACDGATEYAFSPASEFSACGEVAFKLQGSVFEAGHFANYPLYIRYLRRVCDNPDVTHKDATLCLDFLREIGKEDRLKSVPRPDAEWGIAKGMALCPISKDIFRDPSDCRPAVSLMERLNYPDTDLWTARNTACASGDQQSCQDLGMDEATAKAHVKPIHELILQARVQAGSKDFDAPPEAATSGLQNLLGAAQGVADAVPAPVSKGATLGRIAAADTQASRRQQVVQAAGSQAGRAALDQLRAPKNPPAPAAGDSAAAGAGSANSGGPSTNPQTSKIVSNANQCVSAYFDNAIDGLATGAPHPSYTFENTCTQKIYVVWRAKSNDLPGCASSDYLEPGAKRQTGLYPNQVQACGGIAIAACPQSYLPVTTSGANWDRASDGFDCRYSCSGQPDCPDR